MNKKVFQPRKAWGGVQAHVLGKCKYCKCMSLAETMLIDENKKPYHPDCEKKFKEEQANNTKNL